MSLPEFNAQRSHGLCFVKEPDGSKTFIRQDGALFDQQTKAFVRWAGAPPEQEVEPDKGEQVIACKLCDKEYKLGPTEATRKKATERMKQHIVKAHKQ